MQKCVCLGFKNLKHGDVKVREQTRSEAIEDLKATRSLIADPYKHGKNHCFKDGRYCLIGALTQVQHDVSLGDIRPTTECYFITETRETKAHIMLMKTIREQEDRVLLTMAEFNDNHTHE